MTIGLRPVAQADGEFLFRLYTSVRAAELSVTGWSPVQLHAFLASQFELQSRAYRENYAHQDYRVILRDGAPVGRLYLDRAPDELRIVDIALLPEHRGLGIGGRLLRDVLRDAAALGIPATIHVEQHNPAQRLYARLGFRRVREVGIYWLLEWRPDGEPPASG